MASFTCTMTGRDGFKKVINLVEFCKYWNSANNVSEVAERFCLANNRASLKATELRRHGVALKIMPKTGRHGMNYGELAELVN